MRLAVVGQIKRGKSTLVNALLGEAVAATGQLELTFTVNELRHAESPVVTVHYRGRVPKSFPPEDFHRLTVRSDLPDLRRIRRVEYGLPNDLLRSFRLIDTPGLGSVHITDSANTADFLGIHAFTSESERSSMQAAMKRLSRTARDVHRDSEAEIDTADAVLYLFSRGLHQQDQAAVVDFLGTASRSVTPMKAFGVLSRSDQFWPPGPDLPDDHDPMTYDPIAAAGEIAEGYLRRPDVRRLFYTVVPVAGLVAIGARLLTAEQFDHLNDLAKIEPRVLVRRLKDAGRFATHENLPGVTLGGAPRRALIERIGAWGIHLAVRHLRDGLGEREVREQLVIDSGVSHLRELVTGHFGRRAALIKLDHGVQDIQQEVRNCRLTAQREGRPVPRELDEVATLVERLRGRVQGFAELATLSAYYSGELTLAAAEAAELLDATGEHGTTCAARLGFPEGTPVAELEAAAVGRLHAWARREQDPTLDRRTAQAARTVRRGYEKITHRVRRARILLEMSDDLAAEE